ncbi:MAG: sugar phosphate isomerase/epimerase [Sphingobacteriaceae bacterium]|nr:sugar phosphate isomerase/epimerase [Cytophagaceae bacterium]
MTIPTRRSFLKTSMGIVGLALPESPLFLQKPKPRLSFSTLGCPAWPLSTILKSAVGNGYGAVELRGLQNEMELTKCPEFSSPARIAETRRRFEDTGLEICGLGSSAQLHHADKTKRQQNLDEARRYLDLAAQLRCPAVRVFPDSLPKNQDREVTLSLISEGLLELGNHAKTDSVNVLLESHGEVVTTDVLLRILKAAEHPHVGLIWDVFNMWSETGEAPRAVYHSLGPYIRHTHIKDGRVVDGKHQYVRVGRGEAPLREAIAALVAGGYEGYYSLEWEKKWHPELEEPEAVFADYPKAMRAYF